MARIKIKEFGPIKEGFLDDDGFIDIRKVTVFIGDQGSGKSTVAKLISTFSWIEKALVRGDYNNKWFGRKGRFKNRFLNYHRIENYLRKDAHGKLLTEIDYIGEAYRIQFVQGDLRVEAMGAPRYSLPQIMYVPAERNFIANVKNPKALRMTSDSLIEFVTEFDHAKLAVNGGVALPINNTRVEYDKLNDIVHVVGADFKLRLTESSSGFQSLVPLFLVSRFLARSIKKKGPNDPTEPMSADERERFRKDVEAIWANESLTDEQRRVALSARAAKINKSAFINIVEEPEQNLFPTSQWEMLKSLLEFNEGNNKLVITTHSPYLLAHFSLCMQAKSLWENDNVKGNAQAKEKIEAIVPGYAMLDAADAAFYQLGTDGRIERVDRYEGILSDENALNHWLHESNERFDKLLEIEQGLEPTGA